MLILLNITISRNVTNATTITDTMVTKSCHMQTFQDLKDKGTQYKAQNYDQSSGSEKKVPPTTTKDNANEISKNISTDETSNTDKCKPSHPTIHALSMITRRSPYWDCDIPMKTRKRLDETSKDNT